MRFPAIALVLLMAGSATACEAGEPAAAQAGESPTAHVETIDTWLDRIAQRSDEVKTLHATIIWDRIQGLLGDTQKRKGTLTYAAGPPARFAVHFDKLLVDQGRLEPLDHWLIFDGRWFVDRRDDEKQFRKYEVIAPDADPQQADPLALGKGPFAVPLDFKKDRVQQRFDVTLVEPAEGDPENSVHLHLVPKQPAQQEVTEIDLWYDRDSLLPVRARTIDESQNESLINLSNTTIDEQVDEKVFNVTPPTQRGWLVEVKPWEAE